MRKRIELAHALQRQGIELQFLAPDPLDLIALPDEIGRRGKRRDERRGRRERLSLLLQRRGETDPPLGGGLDEHLLDLVQRALREGREGAHLLDLVGEELDPQGVASARREDVDEAAADGELTALLHPLDPLVARAGQLERDLFQAPSVARAKPDRRRPELGRRHTLGESRRRDDDQSSGGQHLQGAGPLTDQVGGRRQPRVPANTAAGQEGDLVFAQEPARSLGER